MVKISFLYKKFLFNFKPKKNLDAVNLKMDDLDDLFNYFGSDKGSKVINPYEKKSKEVLGHGFAKFYKQHLEKFRKRRINFLEIGTWKGTSVAAFYFYLKKAKIFCIDKNFKLAFKGLRINFFNCDTRKPDELSKFINFFRKKNCDSFDVIIDDGSHLLSDMLKNLKYFFKYLSPGELYVIEDYNHPKYFNYLNDTGQQEPFMDDVLLSLKRKVNFKSDIIKHEDQTQIFNDIKNIYTYKGDMHNNGINISDIAFIKKIRK